MKRRFRASLFAGLFMMPATLVGDRIQFRGPGGLGVSSDKGLPGN
jgi:hypothetical protein